MPILLHTLRPVPPKFSGELVCANEAKGRTNADTLHAVWDLVRVPLQPVAQEATIMDCVDSKTRLRFPIFSARIADHADYAALQGIGSK